MDWSVFCCERRITSLNFQGKEGVANAVLKPVGLESTEEAGLHNVPSRGRNYRVEVPQDRRRWH